MEKNAARSGGFGRTLVTLAVPIVIQNFIVSSLNMADTLMLGSLADPVMAESAVAAAGVANQYFFLFNLVANGAAAGASVFISQYWGCGDRQSIRRTTGLGLVTNLLIGLLFTLPALLFSGGIIRLFSPSHVIVGLGASYLRLVCLSYVFTGVSFLLSNALRSIGRTALPMAVSIMAVGTNIILNWVLIFGKLGAPAMGIRGAALATLLARILECGLLLLLSFRKGCPLRGPWKELMGFDSAFVLKTVRQTVPIVLNEGCWALGAILYVAAYGHISDQAIAAFQICSTIQNLFMVVCFGLASAALVMTGNEMGAGRRERALAYSRKFTLLGLLTGLLLGVTVLFAAPGLLTLFNVTSDSAASAVAMLRIFALIAPVRVLNVVLIVGVFRGGGDAGFALAAEGLTMWCIGVPLAFLGAMAFHLPVEQVALLVTLEEIVKCVVCLIRLKSNRWLHNVIGETASISTE